MQLSLPAGPGASALAACLLAWSAATAAAADGAAHVDASGRPQSGAASYYSPADAGKTTASGAPMKPNAMTAASPSLPLGTKAKVVDKATGKSVKVTVTDRGPYAKRRILDVSPKAASQLGMKKAGVAPVKVVPLHEPSPAR
jgi:rare lipoprotein A